MTGHVTDKTLCSDAIKVNRHRRPHPSGQTDGHTDELIDRQTETRRERGEGGRKGDK